MAGFYDDYTDGGSGEQSSSFYGTDKEYSEAAALSAQSASNSATAASASATSAAASATTASSAASGVAADAAAAEAAKLAAQAAQAAAELAETGAETAETNAETAETNAAASASAASTSATNAANSASSAATSASNASTSASAASTSASSAATSATSAATSAGTATTQATAAAASATSASNSATAAASSASAASTSATNAATAETNAATSETNAATSAANASTSETNASASEAAAAGSAASASTSASNAATSATSASNSASAASTSATNAAASETAAAGSASAASASADAALAALDNFDDRYLGQKASAPTVDNDGNPLVTGALYFDTVDDAMKVWDGTQWLNAYASLSGALIATNNLSDLTNAATARTNLGLGTAATTDSTAYATAAQGALADAALPASSYTAADVLTKVKTVDGAGSGLDADTVDGLHSTDVVETSDGVTTNLNTEYDAKMFGWTPSTTGAPDAGYGQGISIINNGKTHNNSNNWITQLGFGTTDNTSYFRTKVNANAWSAWRTIWNSANDGAGSGLDADLLDGQQGTYYAAASSLSNYLPLTGGAITGNVTFGDNNKATFGASADLQIYHSGSHSYIKDSGTGNLYLGGSDLIWLGSGDLQETYATFNDDGAVNLYHNNSAKLATTSTGIYVTDTVTASGDITANGYLQAVSYLYTRNDLRVLNAAGTGWTTWGSRSNGNYNLNVGTINATGIDVTGTITADGLTVDGDVLLNGDRDLHLVATNPNTGTSFQYGELTFGDSFSGQYNNHAKIISNGGYANTTNLEFHTSANNSSPLRMLISSNGDISFYEDTGTTAKFFWDASAEKLNLTGNSTNLNVLGTTQSIAGGNSNIKVGSSDAAAADKGGQINFTANTVSLSNYPVAGIHGYHETLGAGNYSGYLGLYTTSSGGAITERMRIDSSGNLLVGKTAASLSTAGVTAYGGGFNGLLASVRDGGEPLYLNRLTSDGSIASFQKDSTTVGTIGNSGTLLNINGTGGLIFSEGGTEAMRINSNGHLLLGKTSDNWSTVGIQLHQYGTVAATANSAIVANLNRTGTDGSIIDFRKDSTTVGTIGTVSGDTVVGSGDTAVRFNSGGDSVLPATTVGPAGRDAAVNLGNALYRFKDLHLSGTAKAANLQETVYNLTGTALDAGNGGIQTKTLAANTTLTDSMAAGESMTLMIDDGSAYTITWPTITWLVSGGSAPTLETTGYTAIVLWKVGSTLYGKY